jgi:hypothetical protein
LTQLLGILISQAGKTSVFSFQFSFLSPYNKAPARSGQPRGRFGVFSGAIARFAPPYPGKKDRLQFAAIYVMILADKIKLFPSSRRPTTKIAAFRGGPMPLSVAYAVSGRLPATFCPATCR